MIKTIVKGVQENAWLFLKKAIQELIDHDDSNDNGLEKDRAIFATTFIQMSFELSLLSYFLKVDGLAGIVNSSDSLLTEDELLSKYANNELSSKSFNSLKQIALSRNIFLDNDDEFFINSFQVIRNKLVHLNYNFSKSELYDLKYDLTYFIVQVIIPTLTDNSTDPSQEIMANVNKNDFLKLVKFPPYALEMNRKAKENAENVYTCIHCNNESLAVDYGEEYCYSCCENYHFAGFIDCPHCNSKRAMIYDALNIDSQIDRTLPGVCLSCKTDDLIYACECCGAEVALEANRGKEKCHPGFCEEKC